MKKLDKETKKSNEMLAKFVTDTTYECKDVNARNYEAKNFKHLHGKLIFTELRFHKDWNWIMDTYKIIRNNSDFAEFDDLSKRVADVDEGFAKGIEETYDALVLLIKYYENNEYFTISSAV